MNAFLKELYFDKIPVSRKPNFWKCKVKIFAMSLKPVVFKEGLFCSSFLCASFVFYLIFLSVRCLPFSPFVFFSNCRPCRLPVLIVLNAWLTKGTASSGSQSCWFQLFSFSSSSFTLQTYTSFISFVLWLFIIFVTNLVCILWFS